MEITDSPSKHHSQASFGAMLQHARKFKQISLDDVASELFILKRYLQALEDEKFDELPQVAFARGFVINYAKFLDLDTAQIVTSFDAAYPDELKSHSINDTKSLLRPMGTLQRDNRSRLRFNPLLIIAVIALIILAIFLFRMVSNASKDSQEPNLMVEDLTASEQTQGAAINDTADSVGASGSALNLNDSESLSRTSLEVKLIDTATISIIDASGNSLMNGSQISGDYKLMGTPPFNVQIDNIDSVSLLLNQEMVDLDQYATGKQASFELSP